METASSPLSGYFRDYEFVVVVSQRSAHLIIVHGRSILEFAPSSRDLRMTIDFDLLLQIIGCLAASSIIMLSLILNNSFYSRE